MLQNLILCTRLCGTGFIPQHCWVVDFHLTKMVRWKCVVAGLYQLRKGKSTGLALKYFYMIHRGGQVHIWDAHQQIKSYMYIYMNTEGIYIHIYMYVCIYIYIYICIHVYIHHSQIREVHSKRLTLEVDQNSSRNEWKSPT